MNNTIIKEDVLKELKDLVAKVEELEQINYAYNLDFEEIINLSNYRNRINEIIKTL